MSKRTSPYPLNFLGRHIAQAMEKRIEQGEYSSAAEVARALGVDPSTFNRWVHGHAHPGTPEDWRRLTKLGLGEEFLRRLQLLDKLDAWRRDHDLSIEQLVNFAIQIQADQSGRNIFRSEAR